MPGSLPVARPIFLNEELRNGAFATPTLLRKAIDWCRFTYARDLPYLPCDPLGRRTADSYDSTTTALMQAADGAWYAPFGSFYVPDPLGPSRRLVIHLRCVGASIDAGHPVDVLLTSNRGQSTVLTVTAPDAWQDFTWACAPDSVVTIQARSPNGGSSRAFQGICAYWEEPSALVPGASFDTTGTPLPAQSFPVQNRAASMVLARSLARWMNRFTARTTRMVVAKFHPSSGGAVPNYESFSTSGAATRLLKRYKVWVSDNAETVTCRWDISTTDGGASVSCEFVGGSSTTVAASAGTCNVSVTPGPGRVEELVVNFIATGAHPVRLSGFYAFEQPIATAAIPAPSGETLFGSMPALARDSIRAESAILATGQTGWLGVLQALQYLVATRERALVKDSGLVLDRTTGELYSGSGVGEQSFLYAGIVKMPTDQVLRLRLSAHGRSTDSAMPAAGRVVQYEHSTISGVADTASYGVSVAAPKASVDGPGAAAPAAGERVGNWPQWNTVDLAHVSVPGATGLLAAVLNVDTTDGLYEAEWTGCCGERFIPEASVP